MNKIDSNKWAKRFIALAMSYLVIGLIFGALGSLQYVFPKFLLPVLSFQKTRPLHVYLVISWIFTAAQGIIYYYIPLIAKKELAWKQGIIIHFCIQLLVSLMIVAGFLMGYFNGREYLEFPPPLAIIILLTWVIFAINFFLTVKPRFSKAPVYIWSWSTGILFFMITLSESYLWKFDHFNINIIRDITVQWKALGSMVGSWNMLVYGTGMYVMEKISGDERVARSPVAFSFYFLGLINLMFNWGHHTYIVPASPWVRTVSYIISMTELLLLGHIIFKWRRTISNARLYTQSIVHHFLSCADLWILFTLILAISMSVPAVNYYTHGTHITTAHAMSAMIGINSMLLFASVFFILKKENPRSFEKNKKRTRTGILITHYGLIVFCISLLGSGIVKIISGIRHEGFYLMMSNSLPWFRIFSISGIVTLSGLVMIIISALSTMKRNIHQQVRYSSPGKKNETDKYQLQH